MGKAEVPALIARHVNEDGLLLRRCDIAVIQQYFSDHPDADKMHFTCPLKNRIYPIFKIFDESGKVHYVAKFKKHSGAKPLGSGISGKVWLAQDLSSGQFYALKLTIKKNDKLHGIFKANPALSTHETLIRLNDYHAEVTVWKTLNEDPLLDLIVSCKRNMKAKHSYAKVLAVIPFRPEADLFDWIKKNKYTISPRLCLQLCINLVKQVISFHHKGFLHRDIKIENTLIDTKTYELTLIDFGFAYDIRGMNPDVTIKEKRLLGTDGLVAPEVISRGNYSVKSDAYALACSVAEILGLMVKDGVVYSCEKTQLFLARLPQSIQMALLDIIRKALNSSPEMRLAPIHLLDELKQQMRELKKASPAQFDAGAVLIEKPRRCTLM